MTCNKTINYKHQLTPEPHHDNHELLSARIGITASSATAQSQVNRITTGTSKVNVSPGSVYHRSRVVEPDLP